MAFVELVITLFLFVFPIVLVIQLTSDAVKRTKRQEDEERWCE